MKSCPTCRRTFEDTFTFCLADGALLDPPFDPTAPASPRPPVSRNYETRVMREPPPAPSPMVTGIAPALRPTVAATQRPPRSTVPPRVRRTPPKAEEKNVSNAILVLGAFVALICAITAAAYSESTVLVIGGVGLALVLVLVRIFR